MFAFTFFFWELLYIIAAKIGKRKTILDTAILITTLDYFFWVDLLGY